MTWPAATKNALLNGVTITSASLHTAFPGALGLSEVSGGSYARKAVTINAASGGTRALNAAVTFDVPACTVRFVGFWNGATFVGSAANGGATPRNFVNVGSTVYAPSHGYADTQKVVFVQGTPPTGLTEGTTYFVRDSATNTFAVAATSGGTAIAMTGPSSFGCVVCATTEEVYAGATTHQLSAATLAVPD